MSAESEWVPITSQHPDVEKNRPDEAQGPSENAAFTTAAKSPGPSRRRPVTTGTSLVFGGIRNQANLRLYRPSTSSGVHLKFRDGKLVRFAQIPPPPTTGVRPAQNRTSTGTLPLGTTAGIWRHVLLAALTSTDPAAVAEIGIIDATIHRPALNRVAITPHFFRRESSSYDSRATSSVALRRIFTRHIVATFLRRSRSRGRPRAPECGRCSR